MLNSLQLPVSGRRSQPAPVALLDNDDTSVLQFEPPVGESLGLVPGVRDMERCHAGLPGNRLKEFIHPVPRVLVQGAQRFVQAENWGSRGQGGVGGLSALS